jgi:hypothetical protein
LIFIKAPTITDRWNFEINVASKHSIFKRSKTFYLCESVNQHGRLIKSLSSLDWCSEIKSHFSPTHPSHFPQRARSLYIFFPHFLTSAGRERNINFRVADSSAHAEALPYLISGLILFILANYSWGGGGGGGATKTTTTRRKTLTAAQHNSLLEHFSQQLGEE